MTPLASRVRFRSASPPPPPPDPAPASPSAGESGVPPVLPVPPEPPAVYPRVPPVNSARAYVQADMRALRDAVPPPAVPGVLPDPRTLAEALARPDGPMWAAAAEAELLSIRNHDVYEVVDLPPGKHALGSKWVLERKRDGRYKARLVALGYGQVPGEDYFDTYAPVSRYSTLRAMLAICAHHDLAIRQLDIRTAFLHGELKEIVYVRQPPGYSDGRAHRVWRLYRALYGLKQSGRAWHTVLVRELLRAGFEKSADPAVFIMRGKGGRVLALFYVDDCLIAAQTDAQADAIAALIGTIFESRMLDARDFLGIGVTRDRVARTITIDQTDKVDKMVVTFGIAGEFRVLPMEPSLQLRAVQEEHELAAPADAAAYPALLGVLMHLSQCTRPDISYAVGVLSSFSRRPSQLHWDTLLDLARYVSRTRTYGITYGGSDVGIQVWSDSNHARCRDTRRSTTGYFSKAFGGALSWGSRLQSTVAASTQEAEYQAADAAVREVLSLRKILPDLGYDVTGPLRVFGDNEAALGLLKDHRENDRVKHIDIKHHFARERVLRGEVQFAYCHSADNIADAFTKPLPRPALLKCLAAMGVAAAVGSAS